MFAMMFPRPYNLSCIIIPLPPEVLVCHPKLAVTRPCMGPGCRRGWKIQSATLGFFLLLRRLLQSVTNTFFDRIRITNNIRFPKITEYQILNTIWCWENPNTKHYWVLRKSEYRIQIVLFGLTIQIPNTKYQIVNKMLDTQATKINMFVSYNKFSL